MSPFIPYQKHNQPQRSVTYDHDFSRLYKYYKQKDIYSPRIRREVNDKIKSDFRFQMPAISFSSKKHKRTSPKFIIRRLKRSDIEGLASVKIKLDRNETYKLWRKEIKNQGFY